MTIIVFILIFTVGVIYLLKYRSGDSKAEVEIASWAEKEGIVLKKIERKDWRRGPFFLRPNTQAVYRVEKESGNQTITGWLLLSFIKRRVLEVIWEESK